ncbi:rhomboid family intramembrane serine protease [Bacillus timonensis]|nr:rhomboid family intramembrane serine protease [Bacillus timonensis]
MVLKQDLIFWMIVQHLVVKENYRLVQISQSQTEVWLEAQDKKEFDFIRIFRYDLDWSNWLQRDMELTVRNTEKLRKHTGYRKVRAINVYVSTYQPVDDWDFRIKDDLYMGNRQQSTLTTRIVHSDNLRESIQELSSLIRTSFPLPKDSPNDTYVIDSSEIDALKYQVMQAAKKQKIKEQQLFNNGKPKLTYVFIVLQLFMFGLLEMNGGSMNTNTLLHFGAKDNYLIIEGDWWRFFTPIVLHIGFFHLFMNSLALYFLGPAVERLYGSTRFLFIYLFSGFTGSLASFVFSPSISAGASGAIFGCFGALLFFGSTYPKLFFRTMGSNVIGVVILNVALGFFIPAIDNAGHLGGLIGGFLASGIVHLPKHKKYVKRILFLLTTIIGVFLLLIVGYKYQPNVSDHTSALVLAREYIEEEDYNSAYELLNTMTNGEDTPREILFYLSFTEIKLNKLSEAKQHLQSLTSQYPEMHEASYNLALIYFHLEEYQLANHAIDDALEHDSSNEEYVKLKENIIQSLSNVE